MIFSNNTEEGRFVLALEAEIESLKAQVANWERKEISRAVCCMQNEKAAARWKRAAKAFWHRCRHIQDSWVQGYDDGLEAGREEGKALYSEGGAAGVGLLLMAMAIRETHWRACLETRPNPWPKK